MNLRLAVAGRAFRMLEAASAWRSGEARAAVRSATAPAQKSLWIFVSTVGELNAIEPFINRLLEQLGGPALTLITDRSHYAPSYLAKYPAAHIENLSGTAAEVQQLAARRPPLMLVVAEIPALLHDAPCRFSFATLAAAKRAGAPAVLVNGWLYGYRPPSRLDAIENRLFHRDYVQHFDLMLVQTEQVRQRLLAEGADAQRVRVTGNIKFDAMLPAYAAPPVAPLRDALLQRGPGAVIVAGSVSDPAVQAALLRAFIHVRQRDPQALLVLAPRHPEHADRMATLFELLQSEGLAHALRSQASLATAMAGPVLVLDTMGELRGCYQAATLAYVGTDHNVLEPLAFGKPVFVTGGWEPTYPSYPVYSQLVQAGALHTVAALDDLGAAWLACLAQPASAAQDNAARVEGVLARARGAVERNMAALAELPLLQQTSQTLQPPSPLPSPRLPPSA